MAEANNLCKICKNIIAKYSCPKCNILYCSLQCYKSENHAECSENFYKDCVFENLNILKDDGKDSRKQIYEILKRVYGSNDEQQEDLDSDDDEDLLDIHDRLAGVNLEDTEKVWEKLTLDERQEFEAFLRSGDVTEIIPKWQPWWMYYCDKKVLEVNELEEHKTKCPKLNGNIPSFRSIFKKEPTDVLKYNLINILAAYTFTVRYFNGDHFDFVQESFSYIVNLSLNLKKDVNFDSFIAAVDSIQQESVTNEWIFADAENIDLMKNDLEMILRGPHNTDTKYYVMCSLSDFYQLLKLTMTKDANETKVNDFTKILPESQFPMIHYIGKDRVKVIKKKIEFFMAYANDCLEM